LREKLGLKELQNEVPLTTIQRMMQPMLLTKVSSVSGKLCLASEMQQLDTIGIDAVASAINDLAAENAKPLLFYDNVTCARPKVEKIKELEAGIERGCILGSIRYTGSEIKELPDAFAYDQYDLVGFAAGVFDKKKRAEVLPIKDGDVIIALPSNGLHNNGYVAARKKLYLSKASMEIYYETLGATLGELLLQPTKFYRKAMEAAFDSGIPIKSCMQVTHGGLDRAVRLLLHNQAGAVIKQKSDSIPPLYGMLRVDGNISDEQMRQTFNMGVGMLLVVAEEEADAMAEVLENAGEEPEFIGLIERDSYTIRYIKG
jgi:phosphoribosylformylglycinamidine cyclo-ligase